ncbi:hypothetical protein Sru01_64170 [Sphaerisporangium rufum]|uniref:Histidine kinase n=1 Tax=Sphaerisporangium rufum TaxID=1381558 RepID=A0A919V8K5_9ACTN|nr:histidine kinase [Sphaerisporangium rufum]GII81435.1 hypothetical protein Sru01_64170 [Sphaerisporangium rufum]
MSGSPLGAVLRAERPSAASGIVVALACLAAETAIVHAIVVFGRVAPASAPAIIYLAGVLLMAVGWGTAAATAMALASALIFGALFLYPAGGPAEWVILPVFVLVAVLTGSLAGHARARAAAERAGLAASRARIVASTDDTRRRIERDLHDGPQQRLIALGLDLRRAALEVPPQTPELRECLERAARGLAEVAEELREISRGLHPAVLSVSGLAPALKTVARRCPIPVRLAPLDGLDARPLPERAAVAVYHVVAEALADAAGDAGASAAEVGVRLAGDRVRVTVHDDGAGHGHTRGAGLVALRDRVEALGGELRVCSPPGGGTTLVAELPARDAAAVSSPARPAGPRRARGPRGRPDR